MANNSGVNLAALLAMAAQTAAVTLARDPQQPAFAPASAANTAAVIEQALAATPAAQEAAKVVEAATQPIVWYRSEVTVGSLVAFGSALAGLIGKGTVSGDTQLAIVNAVLTAGPLIGSGIALFGRLRSRLQPVQASAPK